MALRQSGPKECTQLLCHLLDPGLVLHQSDTPCMTNKSFVFSLVVCSLSLQHGNAAYLYSPVDMSGMYGWSNQASPHDVLIIRSAAVKSS